MSLLLYRAYIFQFDKRLKIMSKMYDYLTRNELQSVDNSQGEKKKGQRIKKA